MNPSAGSFFVDPRYQRHSWTVSIPFPENESLSQIYFTFLSGHLKRFRSTVSEYAVTIVRASLMIHQAVCEKFKKTAINFHYEFNLRHLSNIFQGMMLSDPARYPEPDRMVRLWIHECERTYGDRLVSFDHLKLYRDSMFEIVKKNFTKLQFSKYFQGATPEALIFCNFTGGINQDRLYDQMPNEKLSVYIE
jgi:dynein heavy chain, axonemal